MIAPSASAGERRRIANQRLGWALGGFVLLLYLIGFFIPR